MYTVVKAIEWVRVNVEPRLIVVKNEALSKRVLTQFSENPTTKYVAERPCLRAYSPHVHE